ncbi:MAG: 23S rRNA (guanosine(2251)-2'-O)-methyltransferase RlmB, partial [Deltaproteobacteria bacterium]|nr:23S rRNA (guanosine(2251)-2'-O)-methyltransferase RlmB [Deltaproteobacteria bacterium]
MSPIIYGIHPVREALTSSSFRFQRILVSSRNPSPSLQTILDLAQK